MGIGMAANSLAASSLLSSNIICVAIPWPFRPTGAELDDDDQLLKQLDFEHVALDAEVSFIAMILSRLWFHLGLLAQSKTQPYQPHLPHEAQQWNRTPRCHPNASMSGPAVQLARSSKDAMEMDEAGQALNEQLERLRSRVAAVTAELGEAKLREDAAQEAVAGQYVDQQLTSHDLNDFANAESMGALARFASLPLNQKSGPLRSAQVDTIFTSSVVSEHSHHPFHALSLRSLSLISTPPSGARSVDGALRGAQVTYSLVSSAVRTAFKRAVDRKLAEPQFAHRLGSRHRKSDVLHCRVMWGEEAVEWKVHDDTDGTEVTFEALLSDVCRYWGVDVDECTLVDERGAVWPLEGFIQDEIRAFGVKQVFLQQRKRKEKPLSIDYQMDERLLTRAEKRKRAQKERERLEALQALRIKGREKAMRRKELFSELWKYVIFMLVYFYVMYSRRSVTKAYYMLHSLTTAFVEENFGDANEKAYMDIRTYGEFYDWVENVFTPGLLPAEYYDGTPISEDEQRVMTYNRLVHASLKKSLPSE